MGGRWDGANMNNLFEILKSTNYYIEYHNFSKESKSEVYISWLDTRFSFYYDDEQKLFISKELDLFIECQKCSVPSLMYLTLRNIVKEFKYPYQLVFFKIDGNPTNSFYFELPNLTEKDIDVILNMQYIIEDFNTGGLTQEHFSMLLAHNMLPYFNDILKAKYNVELIESNYE